MIDRTEILSLAYLKKTSFTGSCEGMRYRLEKGKEKCTSDSGEETEIDVLCCTIWPEPMNLASTPEEKKQRNTFSFDEDGVDDAVAWMNDRLFEDRELWGEKL